ncbi:hypothetical protein OVN18_03995 [Microcella daejeonensis]|uniref:Uncharacterized protein n=1 Tax=Microcella daejeonensis TaxID=2994971 RepID=A0A9E8SC36_9MICO|nr:hypothetical protein [Microcella daejeonensis]WAB82177.1 hypothetical protein OVN18_03995 [Microcella daejeonensis]WAB84340.1 hypothetical protein OVN20_01850 [Microcella daejeonensis]
MSTESTPRASRIAALLARHRRLVGAAAAAIALALAVLWVIVVPEKAAETTGVQRFALEWAHPLCWLLLAVAGALHAMRAPDRLRDAVGWSALVAYGAFLLALLL